MWKKILLSLFTYSIVMISVNQPAFAMRQPAMERSLQLLQNAERTLMQALPNKGGHRARALKHIRKAMQEVRDGIDFANRRSQGGHYKQRKNWENNANDPRTEHRLDQREKEFTEQDEEEKEKEYMQRHYEK